MDARAAADLSLTGRISMGKILWVAPLAKKVFCNEARISERTDLAGELISLGLAL
jgi:hypothetical protein